MNELTDQHRQLLDAYDTGPILSAKVLDGGMFLKPLRIDTAKGRFVLRGTRFRPTAAAFEFQAQAMNHVAGCGIRCPRVLRDRQGRIANAIDGAAWALVEYLEGETCPWPRWCKATHDEFGFVERIAQHVAAVHNLLACVEPEGDPELSPAFPPIQFLRLDEVHQHWNESLDRISQGADIAAKRSRDTFIMLRDELADHWRWLMQTAGQKHVDRLPRQIVHGDVSPVNLVFLDHGKGCGFIDWDNLHVGHRFYDCLGDVLNRPPVDQRRYHKLHIDAVRRYIESYRCSVQELVTDQELACVRLFCLARQMEDLRQRIAALPSLPAELDDQYASLIEIRFGMMNQVRETRDADWII